jgi:hypothetical protein
MGLELAVILEHSLIAAIRALAARRKTLALTPWPVADITM